MSIPANVKKQNNKVGQVMTEYTKVQNWILTAPIDPYEKALLGVVLRYTNGYQTDTATISLTQFAQYGCMSLAKVKRLIKKLENDGLIVVTRKIRGSINETNSYRLATCNDYDNRLQESLWGRLQESLPRPQNSLGGRLQESHSKESNKKKEDILPPYNPPASGGDDAQASQKSTPSSAPASQEPEETPATKTKQRTRKTASEEDSQPTPEEFEGLWFKKPCRLDAEWLERDLIKDRFRELFAEEGIDPMQKHWKFISTAFVNHFTEARGTKALKQNWLRTFETWVRRSLNDNAFRWKKDQEERLGRKQRNRNDPNYADIDLEDPAFQERIQRAMIEGALERGEITIDEAKEQYGYERY